MGHDKLRKFAENETFSCLLQPSAQELLADGYFKLRDHAVKGHWDKFFASLPGASAGSGRETVLELGCGKGEYTVALSERDPSRNYIGVDIKGARLWKGAKYATEHALPNVAFLRTRVEFITAFFAPGEVSEIWLTFSDPQYRSENSRLSSPLFLERYRSFLRPGGIVHLKTDSRFLHEYTLAVCRANGLRILACTADLYGASGEDSAVSAVPAENRATLGTVRGRGPAQQDVFGGELPNGFSPEVQPVVREVQTFYEQLFLEQGYPITYLSFVIDHEGAYVSPRDPEEFDSKAWRAAEGPRLLFGHDSAETRRQKLHAEAGSD
ncbi:MAG: tRNA (guanosine(46)-N7)-methyltransferase TrmB [Bacteroidales bacterium]|nr:tRNA (guanosine(46)-N7)-methyltransferase TrmB [Bacteroidales bacterium]